jgi:hypothetical protein
VIVNPALYSFATEYHLEDAPYEGLDEYLRTEFGTRDPDWAARFGTVSRLDPDKLRFDFVYLISGNVPEAKSHPEAELKVRQLLDELAQGFKSDVKKVLHRPHTKVWRPDK